MNHVVIRPADKADLPEITAIYADAVLSGTGSYEIDPPDGAEMAARHEAVAVAGFPYLVAQGECGGVLGYAYAGRFRARPAYRWMVEDSIYLAPGAKGRGIGTRLLSELIEQCAALGFRQMVAVIGDGAENRASIRLHEKLGFRHCGRVYGSGFKHGRWLDTVLMQLAKNGGDASPPDREPGRV